MMQVRAKSLQFCPSPYNPVDCSQSGSSVHGILQARILEWVAMPCSKGSFQPRDQTCVSGGFFTTEPLEKPPPITFLPKFPGEPEYSRASWISEHS